MTKQKSEGAYINVVCIIIDGPGLKASEAATAATADRLARREAELVSKLSALERERDEAEEARLPSSTHHTYAGIRST